MQTTANLWDVLCRDLEAQRSKLESGLHNQAAKKFREAAEQVFRPGSPRLCDAVEIAGDVCQAAGVFDEAVKDFEESLKKNLALGFLASAARVSAKLALLLDYLNECDRARTYYLQALDLYKTVHDASQRCMLLSHLASMEKRTGRIESALQHYNEALECAVGIYGEVHPEVALCCNNLGVALTDAGDLVRAENAHMRAMGIREQLFGSMHPEVAESMGNLAVVYHSGGNWAKAEAFYNAALKTHAAFQKPGAPEVESVRRNYEKLKKDRPS